MADLISGALGKIQGTLQGIISKGSFLINNFLPPERRADLWAKFQKFVNDKPALASFLLSQIAISGPVLALFITLTITVALFSLIAGLLIGLIGAVLFIVAAVIFALIFVLPTLFFTTMLATFTWLWGMVIYYIIKNFNQKTIPGIHTDLKTGLFGDGKAKEDSKGAASDHETSEKQRKGQPPKLETRSHENGHARKKGDGTALKDGLDHVGKASGTDVGETVNGVSKKVNGLADQSGGVTKNLPVGVGV